MCRAFNDANPWKKDPNYFKTVRISAVALLKMVMHARSGGSIEVMGLMVCLPKEYCMGRGRARLTTHLPLARQSRQKYLHCHGRIPTSRRRH